MAFHCAPALAGIKPSNIFTWHHVSEVETGELIKNCGAKLRNRGVNVESLFYCRRYALVFVYNPKLIDECLKDRAVASFLRRMGYPDSTTLGSRLNFLRSRFSEGGEFPHEIGIFLGYPLEDVCGFMKNRGKCCKCCGEWKVYGDENRSKALFERYGKCRAYFTEKFNEGFDIADIAGRAALTA